eukprot:GGOE01018986.1.p1 GENE.GGOE01018986.1~~GGOE01018986.1.p1  ORF type:complete len:266 (-),score=34.44 GGOE01018986.1:591-1352(-)
MWRAILLFAIFMAIFVFQQHSFQRLTGDLTKINEVCSQEIDFFDHQKNRLEHALVVAIFTGEHGQGYAGYWNKGYRKRRDVIRSSWMREAIVAGIPTFFVLSSWNLSLEHRQEAAQHRDILLLEDPQGLAWGYRGLVHKTLFTLQLMARQCASFAFLLKTDDDSFVHVPNVLSLVHSSPTSFVMIGFLLSRGEVLLDGGVWDNRAFLNDTGLRAYPDYFLGGGYFMSGDVVRALGTLSRTIPLQRWPVEFVVL